MSQSQSELIRVNNKISYFFVKEKVDLYKLLAFLREFLFAPIFLICGILYIYNLFSLS